jgi:hypothetical protein
MTERERRAADVQRLAWLADGPPGLTRQPIAVIGLSRLPELETRPVCRRVVALALSLRGLGRRVQLGATRRAPYATIEQMTA